jgi:hypothetical protein
VVEQIVPLVLSYEGQPTATDEEVTKAYRSVLNAVGLLERILGMRLPLAQARAIRDDHTDWRDDANLSAIFGGSGSVRKKLAYEAMAWWDVWTSLKHAGIAPHENIHVVFLAGSMKTDGSGVGMPVDEHGRVRWDEDANPEAGGLAILGRRAIERTPGMIPARWTVAERHNWKIDLRIIAHEIGHALGRHHPKRTAAKPSGDPVRYRTRSIMGYAYREWITGMGWDPIRRKTVAMNGMMSLREERETWRKHSLMRELLPAQEDARRDVPPQTIQEIAEGYPAPEALYIGRTAEEWIT